ncbi:MAG: type III restriction-modification system endonuclease [Chitinophagales bacterium]
MPSFNFEKNLAHQTQAINSTIAVFEGLENLKAKGLHKNNINPTIDRHRPFAKYSDNIRRIQSDNQIDEKPEKESNIIDIMMETGTGKTYTYTKTIFELNKNFGIFKFIVVVPTLSIKAGTINFLKSDSARQHFKEQYNKKIELHIVSSQKTKKNQKASMPSAVKNFVNASLHEKSSIQVLLINAGMINSDSMKKTYDRQLFDKYATAFEAISAVQPFMIIDEPHKFAQSNKTWENIEQLNSQFILRYGATFPEKEEKARNPKTKRLEKKRVKDYHNLVYTLTAVDSFNKNLVKGIEAYVTDFEQGKNALVRLVSTDGKLASFEVVENSQKKNFKLARKESLQKAHSEMTDLVIEKLNKSTVVLSNGLELKRGDKLNPYAYAQTLQEKMLRKVVKEHFEKEKKLLTRDVKIKPITLFFIDNIEEYRNKDGYLKLMLEQFIKAEVTELLKAKQPAFYQSFLEKTLADISKTHAGYFSKDNTGKDDKIEQEINEILHDKQTMLSLENTRRFIFSKWTLREGWDNPNVFQICKLRSSGSEISKLQEVGRGLRLPVNEYGNRVKNEEFKLNYFVDFTENDFVGSLLREINEKSGAISIEEKHEKLTEEMIKKICEQYDTNEDDLLKKLFFDVKAIELSRTFTENGLEYIKENYPLIFEGVKSDKISSSTDKKKKISIRANKYQDLKVLWEKLNEKVILEYKFENEGKFQKLFIEFLKAEEANLIEAGVKTSIAKFEVIDKKMTAQHEISISDSTISIVTMKYSDFLKDLSNALYINMNTVHQSIIASGININSYLNAATIRMMKQDFNNFLMSNAIDKFSIAYKKVSNSIHPTKLTDKNGEALKEIATASDIGVLQSADKVANHYLLDELYYDSELEKENIKTNVKEVVVFTKIPKNSIKIPVAGGKSYSPDFAYVLEFENGEKELHFVVIETKNVVGEANLRKEELQKIKHAEQFFKGKVKIKFRKQFSNNDISNLITNILKEKK